MDKINQNISNASQAITNASGAASGIIDLIQTIFLYALPVVFVLITLILHSGLLEKLSTNLEKIVDALVDFMLKLTSKKIKKAMLILTIVYILGVALYVILK